MLRKLARVPISTWSYRAQDDSIRHIGPMAQDFYRAFGVGESRRRIDSVDADGVALVAIQGLSAEAPGRARAARGAAAAASIGSRPALRQLERRGGQPMSRRTFVVHVYDDGATMVEDLSTQERASVPDLADVGTQIERWLAAAPADGPRASGRGALEVADEGVGDAVERP